MNITFKTNKLEKSLSRPGEIKKVYGIMSKRIAQRMDQLQAAPNLASILSFPFLECHPLSGKRQGEWAISISGNFRLIFELEHDPIPIKGDLTMDPTLITDIKILEITDYH